MTTALDMIPAIGARVLVRCESMQIECTVKNVKNSWGKPRLLITPVTGTGEQWVEMERVTVPATEAATPTTADWAGCCRASRRIWTLVNAMYQRSDPKQLALSPTATSAEIIACELGIATPGE